MPYANIQGANLFYEDYGSGPAVILTPGGRVDRNGLRPIGALISKQCRVILHDRRNCGRSDVVMSGDLSEQHIWAEEMAGLLQHLGITEAYAAGGSAGSRTSLTLAVRHPELVKGAFIWEVSGGPRSGALMAPGYYGQYIEAAERGGMEAVAATEFFAQRIADNPSNRERLLAMDPSMFGAVMRRWSGVFARPNPVGDLTEAELKSITCPVFTFAGNTPDDVHHVSAAENVHRLVPRADIRPSAWTHEEWDIIGQHDHTFPGIAATNRYAMKATVYAAELVKFIEKVEG
ncbi:MAG: alpha/beta hydrolase [Candidatus Tectomicrobia bacterium]|uniref:Alpha/beta hydrolase n=1 Tax=Tectimicrobiota bacterium TaxID=2528274 RepID=A0A937W083_UNCTE|nr:alpha/beta hydrolase [Candidatus Tectomicrobia bacterium]